MPIFVPGQRWISETEPELGLGTVIESASHRVTVLFIASSERRTYAADNAPLTRVRFTPGDRVESVDGWALIVSEISEQDGLLTYHGDDDDGEAASLEEVELNHFLQFNKPQDRLFTGQIDPSSLFRLRFRTVRKMGELQRSPVLGLVGPRTSLIPHQLYIAHEVATRHAPRVLLADEVGLGKTIEAGLILHHQLLSGRAERVLILVPEPLVHQWLVEMRRRFNLCFSLFDDARYWQGDGENPFESEQLVLCGLDFFRGEPERQSQAISAGWDLCVVDEAHHLEWTQGQPGDDYRFVESLARAVPGLLLLTATPEQLGKESHFARLRLLDPDRFFDFAQFLAEEEQYRPLADVIEKLADSVDLDQATLSALKILLAHDRADELVARIADPVESESARQELIRLILDRHGTGRVLFRNTRATIKGFPDREINAHALPLPAEYAALRNGADMDSLLHPESRYRSTQGEGDAWWKIDPRVPWLTETLRTLRPAKALVICAKAQTAIDLEDALRVRGGIAAAVFHEGLSIVSRDRAAAWFADEEEGAQVLVCSEIGSEGRNFQFAHHLVLFDLPLNPDLLEQRIGRLDRIGQQEVIRIHIPYLQNSAKEMLFHWYQEGLDAFRHPCPAGHAVFSALRDRLEALLRNPDPIDCEALIATAAELRDNILEELHRGRDRLLELNSCRKEESEALVGLIRDAERTNDLWPYLEEVFDAYGVTVEEHSENCYILLPGDHMRVSHCPELPEDGTTVTLERSKGLAREDMLFLTWEHPMLRGTMDLILNSEHGNAAFAVVRHADLDPGQLLL
ncbi:MAG: ATP-dependent helicase HepA, partial [Proteobacteria bacterium]|nr:ATP-dependent helicase HepA [Pseudomonadota bacterium]